MNDIIEQYGDPNEILERLESSQHVDDPEIEELYDRAYDHFHAYCLLVSLKDDISTHNAGYELEQCKRVLNQAEQGIQIRDKTPRGILEPGENNESN